PPVEDADHAGLAQPAMHLDAPGGEPLGHDPGGALLLEADLGMGVEVAAERDELVHVGGDAFEGHFGAPAGCWSVSRSQISLARPRLPVNGRDEPAGGRLFGAPMSVTRLAGKAARRNAGGGSASSRP